MFGILLQTADDMLGRCTLDPLSDQQRMEIFIADFPMGVQLWYQEDDGSFIPTCEWDFVQCSPDGSVSGITLYDTVLETLNIQALPHTVKSLNMHMEDAVLGSIDAELLPESLEKFYAIGVNLIGSLNLRGLPANIIEFQTYSTALSGALDLTGLPKKMAKLSVERSKMSGGISLAALPQALVDISLGHNVLSGSLPLQEISVNLEYFAANNNHFTGSLHLKDLIDSLVSIDVSFNELSGTVDSFNFLPRDLNYLIINNNALEGGFDLSHPPEMLMRLNASHNRFSGTSVVNEEKVLDVVLEGNPGFTARVVTRCHFRV